MLDWDVGRIMVDERKRNAYKAVVLLHGDGPIFEGLRSRKRSNAVDLCLYSRKFCW